MVSGNRHPRHVTKAQIMEREQRMARLEELLLRGVTSQAQLALAFGVSTVTINKWVREVQERWSKQNIEDVEMRRMNRIRQLELILLTALNEFERTKISSEEYTIQERDCPNCVSGEVRSSSVKCKLCGGDGKDEVRPGQFIKCEDCGGSGHGFITCRDCKGRGKLVVESRRIKDRPGDVAFLELAKSCILEASKIDGVYPERMTMIGKRILDQGKAIGGDVGVVVEEVYMEAPVDLLIQAKTALARLKEESKKTIEIKKEPKPDLGGEVPE